MGTRRLRSRRWPIPAAFCCAITPQLGVSGTIANSGTITLGLGRQCHGPVHQRRDHLLRRGQHPAGSQPEQSDQRQRHVHELRRPHHLGRRQRGRQYRGDQQRRPDPRQSQRVAMTLDPVRDWTSRTPAPCRPAMAACSCSPATAAARFSNRRHHPGADGSEVQLTTGASITGGLSRLPAPGSSAPLPARMFSSPT